MGELVYRDRARPEWIDYNGHLSEPFYVMVFGFATDNLMEHVGLDERYRCERGGSLYTVEAHVRYLREVVVDTPLSVTTRVLSVGARKARLCHEMRVDGELVATEELLTVHVVRSRAAPFPDPVADRLRRLLGPAPDYAGRAIT